MTINACHSIAAKLAEAIQSTSLSRLEAELLLAHILGKDRGYLYTWPEKVLTDQQTAIFSDLVARRHSGEPLAYITGYREFWSLKLKVTPDTLIPRPETELMVEHALELMHDHVLACIADLGTGSGAIAAALACELPNSRIFATDRSASALSVARENFEAHRLNNIQTCQGNWLEALPNRTHFDLILSNPPYVAAQDPHLLEDGLPWEPSTALISGTDGLDDIRELIKKAPLHLCSQGWLILEHGMDQAAAVRQLFSEAGFRDVSTHQDLEQRDRLTEGRRPVDDGAVLCSIK